MRNHKFFLLLLLILTLTFSAAAQRRFSGKVVEIVDGKTAVVQMSNGGKLKVVLQYIEIPEPDQPLHQIVREHLQKLILDQYVEINPRGIAENQTIGQIFLKDVDISRQMLRDGAAWYAVLENGGQSPSESTGYKAQEAQAKAEKRGVWGVEGMKPAWEFRAAREEARQAAERAQWEAIKAENQAKQIAEAEARKKEREKKLAAARSRQINPDPYASNNFDPSAMWDNTAGLSDENGLKFNSFPQYNAELMTTAPNLVKLSNGKKSSEIVCQFGYLTYNYQSSGNREFSGFACRTGSAKEFFKNSNQLTLMLDGKKTVIGKPLPIRQQAAGANLDDLLFYEVKRDFIVNLAQADKVQVRIGEFSGALGDKLHAMAKSMVLQLAKK